MPSRYLIKLNSALFSGAIPILIPAGDKANNFKKTVSELLLFNHHNFENIRPNEKEIAPGNLTNWQIISLNNSSFTKKILTSTKADIYYIAFYLNSSKFIELDMEFSSPLPIAVFINDFKVASQPDINSKRKFKKKIQLERGNHLFLLKLISPSGIELKLNSFAFQFVSNNKNFASIELTTNSKKILSFSDIIYGKKINALSINYDGSHAFAVLDKYNRSKNNHSGFLQLFDILKNTITDLKFFDSATGFQWIPKSNSFSYCVTKNELTTIYKYSLPSSQNEIIVEDILKFTSCHWNFDGTRLFYITTEKTEQYQEGLKVFTDLDDRKPEFRSIKNIFYYKLNTREHIKLTNFATDVNLKSVSKDSNKVLIGIVKRDFTQIPSFYTELIMIDSDNGETEKLLHLSHYEKVQLINNDTHVLICGGIKTFEKLKLDKTERIENFSSEYHTRLFIFDIKTKKITNLSENFNPSVNSFSVNEKLNRIYMLTSDKSCNSLFSLDIDTKTNKKITLPTDYISFLSVSSNGDFAIFAGSTQNTPEKIFTINLTSSETKMLSFLNEELLSDIERNDVENYEFQNSSGDCIEYSVYYPLNFDSDKKYPAIIYYYGGTHPTSREFGGRYPKNVWASNGYIVIVIQPSGAAGYSPEFASNIGYDWGTKSGNDIIQGVEKILEKFTFVDKNRMGCIGASYGGFLTLSLISRTNLFACAIAHAPISNLASYWGVGFWGTEYSSIVMPNAYPWNREDIFVKKSPIYNADKIETPLLLLHGQHDVNVPPGESYQIYSALKTLGKDVELIEIETEDHHILDPARREKWSKAILAYFDKHLKNENEWWNNLLK